MITTTKGTMDPEGNSCRVITAGHCTHAELTTGDALASFDNYSLIRQESPAAADKPARRLRKVRTVYVRAVGL